MRRNLISLVAFLLLLLIGYTTYTLRANQIRLKLELQHTQQTKQELDSKLNQTTQEKEQLKKQNDDLQIQLQSKLKQRAILASVTHIQAPRAVFTGNCASWVAQAGITDLANAYELIRRESNCNPYAINASSNACGVAQELPCGKSGCQLGDGACQIRWMNAYVMGRYGSWANAVAWHNAHNWY